MSEDRFGGVEPSDINDKDILEKTKQARNKQGSIQWKYTCEDGHVIQSEWINPENARKAIMIWCDVVRNTVAARAKELAQSKTKSAIILPEDIDEAPLELPEDDETDPEPVVTQRPARPVAPKPKAVVRVPEPQDDDNDEVEDEDAVLLRALKAKRKKLAAKLAKLDSVIELLAD